MAKKKQEKHVVKTAIIGLVVLESIALMKGLDGHLFAFMIAVIAGLGGLAIPSPFSKK